jgi:aspartyl-tRNA(Asn)/glutamyl-tRNA(Gln) amidotransferase subunit A
MRLHRLYVTRAASPVAVVQRHLEQAHGLGTDLNAFTAILDGEALIAAEASERRYAEGRPLSALDGVPFTVKDIVHVRGVPTTAASRAADPEPQASDAAVVARLRQLGAVLIGKTNLLEYALGLVHPDFGPVRNPWDKERTIGGSSSGSAAAVAIGAGFASIGTDTLGSVRNPAALAGVVGFKPSFGRLPVAGTIPLAPTLDHLGILARTVADAQAVYRGTASRGGRGHYGPWRVGVALFEDVDPTVRHAFLDAVARLKGAGVAVQETGVLPFAAATAAALTLLYTEAAEVHRERLQANAAGYSAGTRARILAGSAVDGPDYARALAVRVRVREEVGDVFRGCDVVLTPTLPAPAPREDGGGGDRSLGSAPLHTSAFNLLGLPALTLPIGRSPETGMPIGLQIAGPQGADGMVLRAARLVERLRGPWRAPWLT